MRFKKILFLANGANSEDSVLARAVDLAEENGASLTLIDVLNVEQPLFMTGKRASPIASQEDILVDGRHTELEQMARAIENAHPSITVAIDIRVGLMALEVLSAVTLGKYDLVIKVASRNMGMGETFSRRSERTLLRGCPCPVWIARGSQHKPYRRVLAAVDIDPNKPEAQAQARLIMAIATSIATREESELYVVNAWRVMAEAKLRGRQIFSRDVDRIVQGMKRANRKLLVRLLDDYPYSKRTAHLVQGYPEKVIPDLASQLEIDLIVIGTVGRSGLTGLILGNTADKILRAVDCSVMAVKTEGVGLPLDVKNQPSLVRPISYLRHPKLRGAQTSSS